MAERRRPVDVVLVGMGLTGAILGRELTQAGLSVVGLERGVWRDTVPDFQSPGMHDELRYAVRQHLHQNPRLETYTARNTDDQEALPIRTLGSFLPGTDVGGAAVHWNGQTWRFLPSDFVAHTHNRERYGAEAVGGDLTVQDFGVTYDELEPFYDRFEYLCGIGGRAGNLNGTIRPGGNPFEGPRRRDYPNPPTAPAYAGALFANAALALGWHPFQVPSANMTAHYTNPEGMTLQPCMICGFCERFGCEHFAKSSPQTIVLPKLMESPNFELRTRAHVTRVLLDRSRSRATGVLYLDLASGREVEQPAEIVILCSFGINNVRHMLLSGIGTPYDPRTGEGTIGRNYTYQTMASVTVFYPETVHTNQFMGAGALGTAIDDFNGDNFDHAGLGFIGGAYVAAYSTGARPIEYHPVPPGTPRWGLAWKRAVRRHYNHAAGLSVHGASMATRGNHLDLDPTYVDAYGQPLLRMTFDFPENDVRMANYITARTTEIARLMGGEIVVPNDRSTPYSIVPYQTTHNTGGAVMGSDPKTSAVNRYLQSWDVPNVFVQGACAFPQNPGYNPTGTVGALAYWSAKAIREQYLKSPGPLVR
ncbi:GMC family oxidoreductase [Rhodoplanes sp. TEM]|uniref:GMC family oxidoreductase n=1 Tax=Rhodoplanes tepidamans TaxID=200616 RepID=A0ABT5J5W8_RHOTP|nr:MULTISPECIES: GMC family oxidoreductase [Rhodoplanes]MDC7785053.1 GMC family oxidoreductase [Rhodoplanes tepidamans]MDC7982527.1 GMC family oxidoreductase [Rhodoplanes sp. TEM]MDQ0356541.1 gluconate 2-dehydrogenase alpha chain [Rhodoplanes tepidamans]